MIVYLNAFSFYVIYHQIIHVSLSFLGDDPSTKDEKTSAENLDVTEKQQLRTDQQPQAADKDITVTKVMPVKATDLTLDKMTDDDTADDDEDTQSSTCSDHDEHMNDVTDESGDDEMSCDDDDDDSNDDDDDSDDDDSDDVNYSTIDEMRQALRSAMCDRSIDV